MLQAHVTMAEDVRQVTRAWCTDFIHSFLFDILQRAGQRADNQKDPQG